MSQYDFPEVMIVSSAFKPSQLGNAPNTISAESIHFRIASLSLQSTFAIAIAPLLRSATRARASLE
jgi:hypothetical protein